MLIKVPIYGNLLELKRGRNVAIKYVLPLEGESPITGQLTMDWNVFSSLVNQHKGADVHTTIANGPIEGLYQGIILNEIITFYKTGMQLPAKMTFRDQLIVHNEALMMLISVANNYSFSVNMVK